ncbi:hypothetical protein PMIN03_000778 [Paraphaeosphaeria minitans]
MHLTRPRFMKPSFRKMWDSAVRWTFRPSPTPPETKDDEQAPETGPRKPPTPKRTKKRTTDAHVFTAPSPASYQPTRGVPFLLVQKGKSKPVVSVPDAAISGSAVLVKGGALNTPTTMAPPATASPGSISTFSYSSSSSSSSSLSSPPASPLLLPPVRSPSPAAPSTPSPSESAPLAPASLQVPTSNDDAAAAAAAASTTPSRYPDPDPVAEAFLAPVETQLQRLRLSPAPAPNMRAYFPTMKSHMQLVRERLEPVGAFIVGEVGRLERGGGDMEMRACHYIALHHWPLAPTPGEPTHLRIHETYRNALFKRAQLALRPSPSQGQPQLQSQPQPQPPGQASADDMPALQPAADPPSRTERVDAGDRDENMHDEDGDGSNGSGMD